LFIPDDGGSTYLWNVGRQSIYTAVQPRRQLWTSYPPPWELEISHSSYFGWDLRFSQQSVLRWLSLGCSTVQSCGC
jgi:hypothetical protein